MSKVNVFDFFSNCWLWFYCRSADLYYVGKNHQLRMELFLLSEVSMWRGNNHGKSQMILTEYKLDHKTNKSRSVYLLPAQ